jgi:hypothetical protein
LATVALSATGIQSAATVTLQRTLDSNWRGAYDILVTAKNNPVGAGGLLAPNSLAAGDKGMSLADVAKMRSVTGVDVAAPIGEVDFSGLRSGNASIALPEGAAGANTVPQAFRITATFTTNDGLGPRFVSRQTSNVVIDESPKPQAKPLEPENCNLNGFNVDPSKYPHLCAGYGRMDDRSIVTVQQDSGWRSGETVTDGVIYFDTSAAPQGSTRVTLVDPVEERKLLGSAANFLQALETINPTPMTSVSDMKAWAASANSPFATAFLAQENALSTMREAGPIPEYSDEFLAFEKEHGLDPEAAMGLPPVYVPILASGGSSAPLSVSMTVQSLGAASRVDDGGAAFPYVIPAGAGVTVGATSTDASAILNPFAQTSVDLPWPGTDPKPRLVDPLYQNLGIRYPGAISGTKYSIDGARVTVGAKGFISPLLPQGQETTNPFVLKETGSAAGMESAYSPAALISQPVNSRDVTIVTPVGPFSASQFASLQSKLSYVPLGAYQSIGSTIENGDGKKVKLQPSVSGLGIVSPSTIAIASINSAAAWRQERPVTAVRVRVAGISGYTPQAQQKVLSVAQAVHDLGFTTTIVAGSSPTKVDLTVTDYAFGVNDPNTLQKIGTLGHITQQWSELGAAARADLAVSGASLAVLGIALGSTALMLGAVQFASVPRRRGQAAVMREIGWMSGRIRRWMAAEEVPGLVIVAAAGVAAAFLSGWSQVSMLVAGIGVAVVMISSSLAVVLGSRGRAHPRAIRAEQNVSGRRTLRVRGRTPFIFGLVQAHIHLLNTITQIGAILIVTVAAAGLAEVFLDGRRQAGSSLLAQFTTGQAAFSQLVLAAVAFASGIILSLLARRADLTRRAPQWEAMRAMGWTARDLRRAQRAEALTVSVPAVVFGIAAVLGGAILIGAPATLVLVSVGAGAAISASLALLLVRRKAA